MLKHFLTATAIGGLLVSSALAQQTTPAQAPSASPSTTAAPSASMDSAKFVTSQGANQWVASKFKGTDVLGPNNEHIGDADDLLFDKSGKIIAVIVGVGGFLGIGEKNVAVDMSALQVVPANAGSSTNTASTANDPNDVKLKVSWTKDQLKQAPAFEYYRGAARTTGAATGTNTGTAPARTDTPPANR
jgi:hypothetical protein